jgi:hypothetical protein
MTSIKSCAGLRQFSFRFEPPDWQAELFQVPRSVARLQFNIRKEHPVAAKAAGSAKASASESIPKTSRTGAAAESGELPAEAPAGEMGV